MAGAQAALLKSNTRLRTTAQLCAYVKEWKEAHQAKKSQQYNDLNPWFFIHWEPGQHPRSLDAIRMHSLQSSYCWESSITYNNLFGSPSIQLTNHFTVFNEDKGTPMVLVPSNQALRPNEYYCMKKPCTDSLGNSRTSWKRSNEDVEDIPEVNLNAIEKRRRSAIGLDMDVPSARRVRHDKCNTSCKWTIEQLREETKGDKQPSFSQKSLQRECEQHGLSGSNATKNQLAKRILNHIESVQHTASRRASTKSIAGYFSSEI